ncbi:MAG: M14 family zinc carboxypeptidase [Actinomycetes bacterium]
MRSRLLTSAVALVAAASVAFGIQPSVDTALEPQLDPDRVFPDPLLAGDFVQYSPDPVSGESQYLSGIRELEERYPDVIRVDDICELACEHLSAADLAELETKGYLVKDQASGEPLRITSAGGRELPVITVTDFAYDEVPVEDRVDLYISMSIHGNERAGLEGSLRFIEDLGVHHTDEKENGAEHLLVNGDPERPFYTELTTTEALRAARLVFVNLNPDGWARGDRFSPRGPGLPARGNDNGIDLNRQWPTLGWHSGAGQQYDTLSQPEAKAGRALIEGALGVPEGAADLHGENADDVLLAIMFPAGQFDPGQLAGQVELAEAIKYNVNHSVHPGANGLLVDLFDLPVQPAEYHTAYDAIGYDDSGFQGDYLVQQGILEMDHEFVFSNLAPSNVFIAELEQVHVDTSRELLEATLVTTIVAHTGDGITYTAELGAKTVAVVENPEVLTDACRVDLTTPDAACAGPIPAPRFPNLTQKPYESTTMQYFRDLAEYVDAGSEVVFVGADEVAAGAVDADVLVVNDRAAPRVRTADGTLAPVDRAAFWNGVKDFGTAGGTVVLTDAAMQGLVDMGVVGTGSVTRTTQYAGEVQDIDRSHPLLTDVGGVIGQTYFEVPIGYRVNTSPAWRVNSTAWRNAGGSVAATADGQAALGSAPLGAGRVTVFGAILPTAFQGDPHTHGLADYAVTYAGNAILVNALAGR